MEEQWAAGVAAELGDYAGVVHRRAAQKPSASADPGEYAAWLAFQAYIEEGNHAALMARGGHYAELYNTYFRHQSLEYIETARRLAEAGLDEPKADVAGVV